MSERFLPWFGNDLDTGDYPDVGNGEQPCCMGSAVYGPERCTCWRPVFDHPQSLPMQKGPMRIRPRMCADCAFRPDSPERTGDERFAHSGDGEVDSLVNETFVCHQGLSLRAPRCPSIARSRHRPGLRTSARTSATERRARGQSAPSLFFSGLCRFLVASTDC